MRSFQSFQVYRFLLGMVCSWIFIQPEIRAEVQVLNLPVDCADFAYNSDNATIAALDNENSKVLIFDLKNLESNKAEPFAAIKVGQSPCSICYKKYKQRDCFAVVCSQDSSLYLIEAEGASEGSPGTFKLTAKINLDKTGVSSVTASINPEDPFIYYCYGGGHDSFAGAVSLKSTRNTNFKLSDSMDCAVSASGEVIYHRGPWSPSGFKSVSRINSLEEEIPEFAPLFSEHRSAADYLPDQLDTYTASGPDLHTRDLSKKIATLPFFPVAFFKTKPIIIGIKDSSNSYNGDEAKDDGLSLRAASYNTFKIVGTSVPLEHRFRKEPREMARSDSGSGDFKRIVYRYRAFADDLRKRVLFADGNQVFIVDLADFEMDEEPLVAMSAPANTIFTAGRENALTIELADPKVQFNVDDMPDGMKLDGNTLHWKPTLEQIGSYKIATTLSFNEINTTRLLEISVQYPSLPLPFTPSGFTLDATNSKAVIWDGNNNQNALEGLNPAIRSTGSVCRLAVIDLKTGNVDVERKLSDRIGTARIFNELVLIKPLSDNTPRCDILKLNDLQRIKSIVTTTPIHGMAVVGSYLILETSDGRLSIYETNTFEQVKSFEKLPGIGSNGVIGDKVPRIFANGILWDKDLKPALILAPPIIPAMGQLRDFTREQLTPRADSRDLGVSIDPPRNGSTMSLVATRGLADANLRLRLYQAQQMEREPNSPTVATIESKVIAMLDGAVSASQVFETKKSPINRNGGIIKPSCLVELTSTEAFIISDKSLYRWDFPKQEVDAEASSSPLSWNLQTSTNQLAETGKTELKHKIIGGKPPYSFGSVGTIEGIVVDEKTGTVAVDNAAIQAAAEKFLIDFITRNRRRESRLSTLRLLASELLVPATEILGRRPTGVPVAVPIQLLVTDDNIGNLPINYFVVTEVNSAKLMAALRKLDEQQSAEQNVMPAPPAPGNDGRPPMPISGNPEIEKLNKRIDQLEQRLDLMTRQLNELLKKLDAKEK
jgi:hypothetical protein